MFVTQNCWINSCIDLDWGLPTIFNLGVLKKVVLVFLVGFLAWGYQATRPPPPKKCGSNDGPPLTAPRIQLRDGRFLAYKESGVPKDDAKHKLVFVHGFDSCRHDVAALTAHLSPVMPLPLLYYLMAFDSMEPFYFVID